MLILSLMAFCSCSEWTETKSVDLVVRHPWEQDGYMWELYLENLIRYKESDHYVFYALFENNPESETSESCRLRSLPDSLDFVSLTNADNFSQYDAEDMEWMASVGTKVLYRVDLDKFTDAGALSSYLDGVISSVGTNSLSGYALSGTYKLGDDTMAAKASTAMSKLSGVKTLGQYIVLRGIHLTFPERTFRQLTISCWTHGTLPMYLKYISPYLMRRKMRELRQRRFSFQAHLVPPLQMRPTPRSTPHPHFATRWFRTDPLGEWPLTTYHPTIITRKATTLRRVD